MKRSIVIFFIILNSLWLSGQDFFCPEEINFGDFNIIARTDSESDFSIAYTPKFSIYKIVQDEIFFQNGIVKPLYDSSIVNNGNYLQFLKVSYNKDTLEMNFRLSAIYLDSISSLGEFLKYEFIFYYLKQGNDYLDSQKVRINLKLKNEKELFLAQEGRRSLILRASNKYGDTTIKEFAYGYLLNFTNDNFIIDSIKQVIDGKNFFKFTVGPTDSIVLPLNLKSKNRITFQHWYSYFIPETARSIICFYGHFENNNQLVVLKDTNQIKFGISDGYYFYNTFMQYYLSIYTVDTVKMSTITITNNTDSLLKFKSFNINSDPGLLAFFKNEDKEPPVGINPWNRFSIKEIYLQSDNPGKYRLKVSMNFEKANNEKFSKDMDLIIDVIPKKVTNITNNDNSSELLISPNPASDYIEINMPPRPPGEGWGEGIRIFDLLGVEHPGTACHPSVEGNLRIDVSSLQPGVYFVRVGNEVRKFVKM